MDGWVPCPLPRIAQFLVEISLTAFFTLDKRCEDYVCSFKNTSQDLQHNEHIVGKQYDKLYN